MTLRAPIRIDLLGGWSDSSLWPVPSAVINASATIGDGYPLEYDGEWRSEIEGVGTGLGISSIRYAVEYLADNPGGDYTAHVIQRERDAGTMGGWQDALGALEPGLKLLTSWDHSQIDVTPIDPYPIWPHLLLFDTGTRRDAGRVGGMVRRAIQDNPGFRAALVANVCAAKSLAVGRSEPRVWMRECCDAFGRLNRHVEMQVPFPAAGLVYGWKPMGAGGGGYGLAFLREPQDAAAVIAACREAGVWAVQPKLAMGMEIVNDDRLCERVLPVSPQRPHRTPAMGAKPRRSPRGQRSGGRNNPGLQGTLAPAR